MDKIRWYAAVAVLTALLVSSGVGSLLVGSGPFGATEAAAAQVTFTDAQTTQTYHHEDRSAIEYVSDYLCEFNLTDEQTEEIIEEVGEVEADGGSRQEIRRTVVRELMKAGYSVEEIRTEYGAYILAERFDITESQAEEVVSTAREMRDDGADRSEIRETVKDKLRDFDATPTWAQHIASEHSLSETQTDELVRTARELHEEGSSPVEIRRALGEKLLEFGVSEEELSNAVVESRANRAAEWAQAQFDLTDEQAEEVESVIVESHEEGADRAEIRGAVRDKLIEFGVSEEDISNARRNAVENRRQRLGPRR